MDADREAEVYADRTIISFDLDGTLTASKQPIDDEAASLVCRLLAKRRVAVMSGGKFLLIKRNFLRRLPCGKQEKKNLLILPTSGASMYAFVHNAFSPVYRYVLTVRERQKIFRAFADTFADLKYASPRKVYGDVLEDRETQVTFSALGQKAPISEKEKWNTTEDIRPRIVRVLRKHLPDFLVRIGGKTSIDVSQKGFDKAYGMRQILAHWNARARDAVYVGDALFKGGNDEAVKKARVATIEVKDPEETKKFIRALLEKIDAGEGAVDKERPRSRPHVTESAD